MAAGKRVLIVCSSHERLGDSKKATGLYFGEAAHFYDVLAEAGCEIDMASPRGGYIPIDPSSINGELDPVNLRLYGDAKFRCLLGHSLTPEEALKAGVEKYDAVYFAGGHGTSYDFKDDKGLQKIATTIYEKGGIVSGVCHGVNALIDVKLSDGTNLIAGKKVTGFSDAEETLIGLHAAIPFSTEGEMKAVGAKYEKAPNAWDEYVVVDGRVVTGQNPASAKAVAVKLLELFK